MKDELLIGDYLPNIAINNMPFAGDSSVSLRNNPSQASSTIIECLHAVRNLSIPDYYHRLQYIV